MVGPGDAVSVDRSVGGCWRDFSGSVNVAGRVPGACHWRGRVGYDRVGQGTRVRLTVRQRSRAPPAADPCVLTLHDLDDLAIERGPGTHLKHHRLMPPSPAIARLGRPR